MAKFTLTIDTSNAAFADGETLSEVARILFDLASDLCEDNATSGALYDSNGNAVGTWKNGGK
jgi:hypothetical protein